MREDYLTGESSGLNPAEKEFEEALRAQAFDDFFGQEKKKFVRAIQLY